jgi:aryl-alcohol dehydrogenase-like predicted oxidoreductase
MPHIARSAILPRARRRPVRAERRQSELSLWTRDAESVLSTCAELGTAFVAFSPLGRGFLTGALSKERIQGFDRNEDLRALVPRFQPEHLDQNLRLLEAYRAICHELGRPPAQVALAWVLAKGDFVHVLAGSTSSRHLRENLGALEMVLSQALISELDELFTPHAVSGGRAPMPLATAQAGEA